LKGLVDATSVFGSFFILYPAIVNIAQALSYTGVTSCIAAGVDREESRTAAGEA